VKKLLAVTLGILTAIGGFVDIGDLVTNAQVCGWPGWWCWG
jgi:manganese transport protein